MDKVICVYSSSSNTINPVYFAAAAELGEAIALRGDSLLFGGGQTGLMGACARAVHAQGGRVIGVIPEALNVKGVVYERCDDLIVTKGMRERKAIMDSRSDAFVALPGGYGTLEEILEIITLKQLRYHNRPIILMNTAGYYDALLRQFDTLITQQFAKGVCFELYYVAPDADSVLRYLDNYTAPVFGDRWMTDVER